MPKSWHAHHAASLDGLLVHDKPDGSKEGAQDDPNHGDDDEKHHL